ncbi:hypothetical protein DPMN_037151 [Dreissena polymorpha]|uniref:Uncharacterized protein n=1 Tax=Dreissena polymorpha TaxID=45954 RepID=A0A9D4MCY8_DREPO|nr:hypothetical protein DPMN_037151 [Dreissena polymorpha]
MSAGFCTSFGDIINRDIRHIYSDKSPSDIRLRHQLYHEGIDPLDRIREQFRRQRTYHLPAKCYEYLKDYDIVVQKATGFQRLPKSEINKCVERLHSPKRSNVRQRDSSEVKNETERTSPSKVTRSAPAKARRIASSGKPNQDGGQPDTVKEAGKAHDMTASQVQDIVDRVYTEAVKKRRNVRTKAEVPKPAIDVRPNRNKLLSTAVQMKTGKPSSQ